MSPAAQDGDYVLYHGNDPSKAWTAYCDGMATTPAEYLPLVYPNAFVDSTLNWQNPKYVSFSRVRIDPATLVVNVSDLSFAVRTGDVSGEAPTYATAASCVASHGHPPVGTGTVDLRGTPFRVDDTFDSWGWCALPPVAIFSSDDQVVSLEGDGSCGYTSPASRAAFYGDGCLGVAPDPTADPDWALRLAFLP